MTGNSASSRGRLRCSSLTDNVIHPQLGAAKGALEEVGVIGKPVELRGDRRLVHVIDLETIAQPFPRSACLTVMILSTGGRKIRCIDAR